MPCYMYQEQLQYIINNQFRVLRKYIKKIMKDFDEEDLHQFRVGYKKLRAFVRMLSMKHKEKANNNISKKLKKCYQIVGAIRDLQLQDQRILEATQEDTAKPDTYLQLLRKEIAQWKTLFMNTYSKRTISESKRKTVAFIPDRFPLTGFNNFKKDRWNTIYTMIESRNFSDDNLHAIRKSLKDLYYNQQLYEAITNRKLSIGIQKGKDTPWFDKLLDDLGRYQDLRVAMSLLKPAVFNYLNRVSRNQMERIKKIWTRNKVHLKKLLVKQLITQIGMRPVLP